MARSGFEKTLIETLKELKVKYWYEPLKMPYTISRVKNYMPDFVIYKGKLKKVKKPLTPKELKGMLIIEAKGFFKYADREKMLAVKECYPDLDIRMLFMNNGYIYKNKKGAPRRTPESTDMRYSDWCDKHGYPWAISDIPKEWYETHEE